MVALRDRILEADARRLLTRRAATVNERHWRFCPAQAAAHAHAAGDLAMVQLEVSASAISGQRRPRLLRRVTSYAEFKQQSGVARGLPAAGMRRAARRPRRAVHAEQPAVRHRVLRDPARRRGGRAHQSDEPERSSWRTSSGLPARRSSSPRRTCIRASSRCSGDAVQHVVVACYSDYVARAHRTRRFLSRSPRPGCRCDAADVTLWQDALARGISARPRTNRLPTICA